MEKVLELNGIIKIYGTSAALSGLNMTVYKGDVYAFLGRNGSGKTTAMDIIANVIPKDGGRVKFGETETVQADGKGTLREKVRVGYLSESPGLLPFMTGMQYLRYIAGVGELPRERITRAAEISNLGSAVDKPIKYYSRGMYQSLGIAAVTMTDPDLLLLDEPTSALDPSGRAEVISVIKDLSRTGVSILLSTHILSDAEHIAARIGILGTNHACAGARVEVPIFETAAGVLMKQASGGSVMLAEGTTEEILQTHAGVTADTVRITVSFAEAYSRERTAPITAAEGVVCSETDSRGRLTLTVGISQADSFKRELARLLSEQELSFTGIETERPTLESVYLELTAEPAYANTLTEVEPKHVN
ncbi:ABC transporter ATP-binding protein [Clostridia bacterium]|nr:ABC transporter ATP-binding protein [Clostridia bacterium]